MPSPVEKEAITLSSQRFFEHSLFDFSDMQILRNSVHMFDKLKDLARSSIIRRSATDQWWT